MAAAIITVAFFVAFGVGLAGKFSPPDRRIYESVFLAVWYGSLSLGTLQMQRDGNVVFEIFLVPFFAIPAVALWVRKTGKPTKILPALFFGFWYLGLAYWLVLSAAEGKWVQMLVAPVFACWPLLFWYLADKRKAGPADREIE